MAKTVSPPAQVIRVPVSGDRTTFCVLGVPRGGTSMVSGLLTQLGIPMGESIDKANVEDLEFTMHRGYRRLFWGVELQDRRAEYIEHLVGLIKRRNERYGRWGWKDPIAIHYLEDIETHLVNPHFLLVTRDCGAVALAEMKAFADSNPEVLTDYLHRALDEYGRCVRFLIKADRPLLLLSYERALRYPRETVEICAKFVLGETARLDGRALDSLAAYIRPDRQTAAFGIHMDDGVVVEAASDSAAARSVSALFGRFDEYRSWMEAVAARPTPYDEPGGESGMARPSGGLETGPWHRWLEHIYGKAATATNRGEWRWAGTLACRCLKELAASHPLVAFGPVAVARAIDVDRTSALDFPELLVGLYNIIGMSALQGGDPGMAQDHFESGHRLARLRMEDMPVNSKPLARDLVWWLAFHAAVSARAADRPAAWRRNIDSLRECLALSEDTGDDRLNLKSARSLYERAGREGLLTESIAS